MTPPGRLQDFHQLMRHRIMDILLVASPYDAFVLEEAGQLGERVLGELRNLDLHYGPGLTTVSTGGEALEMIGEPNRFGLIISGLLLGDMTGDELAREVEARGKGIPVVLLAFDAREVASFMANHDLGCVEKVFLWQGDARILLAIIKYVEDRRNALHDAQAMGVQVIILIEDNVRYYSSFLPVIYSELLEHSRRLVTEGINVSDRIMRMRARPKILLCGTYEEAWEAFTAFQDDVLGVISDIEFPADGMLSPIAGLDFARRVRGHCPDVPVLLQSSNQEHAASASEVGAGFLLKGSATLLTDLRRFMIDYFGFGEFVFRRPSGAVVGTARDLGSLEQWIGAAPADSLAYHAAHNHFSSWLKARTEFALAGELRARKASEFPDPERLRSYLLQTIARYLRARGQVAVADFDRSAFDPRHDFHRIGGGSLGGKARGLAFMRALLGQRPVTDGLDAVVRVPAAVVLATDVFDRFLDDSDLRSFAIHCEDEEEVVRRFLAARFPDEVKRDLAALLSRTDHPLAIRSSSLLEDSQHQPFAGIYETFMLPNRAPQAEARIDARLDQLIRAIVRVYASMFSRRAKDYIATTPYRLEEEKMAVIVQRLVGAAHGTRFYPHLSGVARSHNCYPTPPLAASDGIAAIALGLGKTVVAGGSCLRFCPRYPRHLVQFSSVKDMLANSQRAFWALDLAGDAIHESRYDLEAAEADGALAAVGSTYSPDNDAIYDGTSRPGIRLVSFASILKHESFPLATLLDRLLAIGRWGMGGPVEIEFAVDLARRELAFLQLRPLAMASERSEIVLDRVDRDRLVCRSDSVLGNGRLDDLRDVVVVDRHRFSRASSPAAAADIARLNAELAGRPYALIGVGRWGSADPWLGIPVSWEQIAGARVIVEAGFADLKVTPSQGTHFFQNLTSSGVGYFTVNPDAGDGFVDWDWLAAQPAARETPWVRHLRFSSPVVVQMNGKTGQGIIVKPASG